MHPDRLATKSVDGKPACADCAATATERHLAVRESILVIVAVGYLGALAVGFVILKGRPIVGGLAAVIALMLGRTLQVYLRAPVVVDAAVIANTPER